MSAASYEDVRGKSLRVQFILSGPADVTITVMRDGKVLAELGARGHKSGRGSLTWNGRLDHKLATRGSYKIILRAVSPTGASASDTTRLRIT